MHRDNLINSGIIPLVFEKVDDYDGITLGDKLEIQDPVALVENGRGTVRNVTSGKSFGVRAEFTERQKNILKAGGTVNLYKNAK